MDRVRNNMLTDLSKAKAKEKSRIEQGDENAILVNQESQTMLQEATRAEEKIQTDTDGAADRINELATARIAGIAAVKNAMHIGKEAVVKQIHEAAQGDIGDVTAAWHELVKTAGSMSGDIEDALSEASRLLNKGIDGQYDVIDADVSGLQKRLST